MKITKSKLKQIIKEELSEISDELPPQTMASRLAQAGSAEHPYEASAALLKLFAELHPAVKNEPQEAKALADTIFALLDSSVANVEQNYNLEEGFENITPENLKLVYDVMVKMAPMLGMLTIGTPLLMAIEKKLNNRELEEEGDRTAKGNVTQDARDDHATLSDDRFPIFDKKSALAALKLRGHGTTDAERKKIINKAAKYASEAAKKAREADAEKK